MTLPLQILASSEDLAIKAIIFVVAIIFWGISSLAKMLKKGADQQKERMRQVRESILAGQAPQTMTRPPAQMQRPPVQLAPAVARQVAPQVQPQQRRGRQQKGAVRSAKPQASGRAAPPPIPLARADDDATLVQPLIEIDAPTLSPTARKPATVNAVAIKRWMKPATLRQQFILTELFQPPIALRPPRE